MAEAVAWLGSRKICDLHAGALTPETTEASLDQAMRA